jgi:GcrA cell cycle regulator
MTTAIMERTCERTCEKTWTAERIDQLKSFVGAGLTCSQIAAEIGVTRNAVIGKINRLGLGPGRAAAAPGRPCPPRLRPPRLRTQRALLRLIDEAPPVTGDAICAVRTVDSPQSCALVDLTHGKCRWPLSEPGAADFVFCGNDQAPGFSYCAGHARMAYRPTRR